MTTIVPMSEDDPVLAIVRLTSELAWADGGPGVAEPQVTRLCIEAQECMVMGRWVDLVSLMLTSVELITSKLSEKDFEFIFTVICTLATRAAGPDDALEIAKLISTKIIQQPSDKSALRLKILFNLYNLLENSQSRFFVYAKALNLAVTGQVTEIIIPSFKMLDSLMQEWNIGKQEQRELFLTISNILRNNKSMGKEYFSFLSKYLRTFSAEEALAKNEAKEEAVRAIIEFVKSPDMFQCELQDIPAVALLEKDGDYVLVYQLLKVFLTSRLDAYLDLHAANSTLLKSYGLIHEDCIAKMRLMSLIDLSCNESGEIAYSQVRETLRINDDEVEYWIVKAMMSKLVDCKMDQLNQVVIISRHTEKVFGLAQWEALRSKLGVWRANIARVVGTIKASKVAEDGVQVMQ